MHRSAAPQPDPASDVAATDVASHRCEVVRRLLALGVSAYTLEMLLPDWSTMIAEAQPLQSGNPT